MQFELSKCLFVCIYLTNTFTDSTSTSYGIEKSMCNEKVDGNRIEQVSSDTPIDCSNREMSLTKSPKESMLIRLNNIESNEQSCLKISF